MGNLFGPSSSQIPVPEESVHPCHSSENPCQKMAEYMVLGLGLAVGLVVGINISSLVWGSVTNYLKTSGGSVPSLDKGVSHKEDKKQSPKPVDGEERGSKRSDPPAKRRPVPENLVLQGRISRRQTRVHQDNDTSCTPAHGAKPSVHVRGTDDEKASRCHLVGGREERRNLRRRNFQDKVGRHHSGFFYKESHRRAGCKLHNQVAEINVLSLQGWQGSLQQAYDARNIHGDTTREIKSILQPSMEQPNASASKAPTPLVNHSDPKAQRDPRDPRYPGASTKPKPSIVQSTLTPKMGDLNRMTQKDCADQTTPTDLPGPTSSNYLNPRPQRNPSHPTNCVEPIPVMCQPDTRLQAVWSNVKPFKNLSDPQGQEGLSHSRPQMILPDQSHSMGSSELQPQNEWLGPRLQQDCTDTRTTIYESGTRAPGMVCRPQTDQLLSPPLTLGRPYSLNQRPPLTPYTTDVSAPAQKPRAQSNSAYNIGEVSLHAGRRVMPLHLTPDLGSSPDLHLQSQTIKSAEHRARHHSEMTPARASFIPGNRTIHYDHLRGDRYLQECPLPEHPEGHIPTGHLSNELKCSPSHEPEADIHPVNKQEILTYGHNSVFNIPDPKNAPMLQHSSITLISSHTGTGRVVYDARATRIQSKEQVKKHTRHNLEKELVHPTTQQRFLLYDNNGASRERNHLPLGPRLPPSIITRPHYTQVPKDSLL